VIHGHALRDALCGVGGVDGDDVNGDHNDQEVLDLVLVLVLFGSNTHRRGSRSIGSWSNPMVLLLTPSFFDEEYDPEMIGFYGSGQSVYRSIHFVVDHGSMRPHFASSDRHKLQNQID